MFQLGRHPLAVNPHFDALHGTVPGPGPAAEHHGPRGQDPAPGEEVRDSRRDHQRADVDPGDRRAGVVHVLLVAVGHLLLEPVKRLGQPSIEDSHLTLAMPYQPGTTRRSG